jgi:hypothetical protein
MASCMCTLSTRGVPGARLVATVKHIPSKPFPHDLKSVTSRSAAASTRSPSQPLYDVCTPSHRMCSG